MRLARYVLRSLVHYRRTNVAVVAGVAVGAAALTGALVVGDSVRGSLRELAVGRLGTIDYAMVAPRFVRAALGDELASDPAYSSSFEAPCPLILLSGGAKHADSGARANQVTILGVDDRFWRHSTEPAGEPMPVGRTVILNALLAEELGAAVGQDVLLNFGRHDAIATETLLGRRDETTTALRLTVAKIIPAEGLGAFSPNPSKSTPKNAFVPLDVLQRSLNQPGRINALVVQGKASSQPDGVLSDALRRHVRLEDFGLRLRENSEQGYVSLDSESLLIPPPVEGAATKLAGGDSRVLTHLANLIRKEGSDNGIPYSTVAAIDPQSWDGRILTGTQESDPPGLGGGEILLNQWAVDDLGAKVGDRITLSYYVTGAFGKIETRNETFTLRGVVAMSGLGTDAGFVPEYKGITDTQNLADWNPPFPVDLKLVREKDEEYWDKYKTTPKAFVTLAHGQRLWADQPDRFGRLTSIRRATEAADQTAPAWAGALLEQLPASGLGLTFEPVRQRALAASSGNTDFGMLFIGFSSFLILSSAMLVALLFRLSVERRAAEFGVLLATGFSPRKVLRLLLVEGSVLSVIGAIAGAGVAGGYAWLMLAGLRTWWSSAVNAPFLRLHVERSTLSIGAGSGVVIAMLATAWSMRGLMGRSPRALISGATGEVAGDTARRGRLAAGACGLSLVVAAGSITASTAWKILPEAVGFFLAGASMLTACLTGLAWRLRADPHAVIDRPGFSSLVRLAWRNAPRYRGRSLLTAALIACAAFVVLALEAFRLEGGPTTQRSSGSGGYAIYAESVTPLPYDLNTASGREAMNADDPALAAEGFSATAYRLRPGDESSCLSLYRPNRPRVLGVPQSAVERGGFAFSATLAETDAERANPWTLLNRSLPDGAIPAIGDEASVKWQLHLDLGKELVVKDERGQDVRLRFVALLKQSVLQNEVLIAESRFTRVFPSVSGYGFFLIEANPEHAEAVERVLEAKLDRFGFDAAPTSRRIAEFQAVQNTYLSTFQALGGLGLILGSAGLAAVMLRNVWERRRELALMRAVGFAGRSVGAFVLLENLSLVVVGLLAAALSAAVATAPALAQRPAEIPWLSVAATLAMVLLVASITCLAALRPMFRASTQQALRGE